MNESITQVQQSQISIHYKLINSIKTVMTELWQSLLVVITNISLLFTTAPTGDGQTGDGHGSKQGHE